MGGLRFEALGGACRTHSGSVRPAGCASCRRQITWRYLLGARDCGAIALTYRFGAFAGGAQRGCRPIRYGAGCSRTCWFSAVCWCYRSCSCANRMWRRDARNGSRWSQSAARGGSPALRLRLKGDFSRLHCDIRCSAPAVQFLRAPQGIVSVRDSVAHAGAGLIRLRPNAAMAEVFAPR